MSDTLHDASEIVSGAWHPWEDNPHVATPAEWRSAAQCAVDGDPADLRHFLDRMDEPGEPMNGDYEFYKEAPETVCASVERSLAA